MTLRLLATLCWLLFFSIREDETVAAIKVRPLLVVFLWAMVILR
jgi:hypothetical protein